MKIFGILIVAAVLAFASCKSGQNKQTLATQQTKVTNSESETSQSSVENTKYNPADARTFGLVGPVQEVRLSKALLSTTSTEEQGDPWLENDELEMTFDEYGRVTLDGLGGCKYVYDENGNFIRGFSDKTTMERDATGRIVSYVNTNIDGVEYSDINFAEYVAKSFEYDELNRVAKAAYSGWEWKTDNVYEYFGGNVYPKKVVYETAAESLIIKGTITYEYLKYDQYGNWLERNVTLEEETCDYGETEPFERLENVYLERRTIKYYPE